jgi:hypothetical protein
MVSYPLTEAKKRMRKQLERRRRHNHAQHVTKKQASVVSKSSSPSKICPPQVKRHIFTHPDKVPLAQRPTMSWLAKVGTEAKRGKDTALADSYDLFTRDSIERKLRAEASWFKFKVYNVYVTKKHRNEHETSFRRMVGAFSKPSKVNVADHEETLQEKMAHVVEELSERLEEMERIE